MSRSSLTCEEWASFLESRRKDFLQKSASEQASLNLLTVENPNTPFSSFIEEDGNKRVDFSRRKYSFQGKDLTVSQVQNRRKYEALKCLAHANGVRGKFETKYTIMPLRIRNRLYGCGLLRTEADANHTFRLFSSKSNAMTRTIQFDPTLPFFPTNGVGPGSSPNSDAVSSSVLAQTSVSTGSGNVFQ